MIYLLNNSTRILQIIAQNWVLFSLVDSLIVLYYFYYTKLYYSNIFYNGIVLSNLYYCSGGINMFNIKDDVLKGLVYIYMILYKYSILS